MKSIPLKITKIHGKLEKIAIFRGIDFISLKKEMKSIPLKITKIHGKLEKIAIFLGELISFPLKRK